MRKSVPKSHNPETRNEFLLELIDALSPLSDPAEIQTAVTTAAMEYFGADRCFYCEIEEGKSIIRRDAALESLESVAGVYDLDQMPIFQAVLSKGVPFAVSDVNTSELLDENLKQLCISLNIVSFIDVPIVKVGATDGLLCITQCEPRDWTEPEIELAREIAFRTWETVERARTEDALARSEEKYRTLFSSMDDGFCLCELLIDDEGKPYDYRFLEANASFEKHSGGADPVGKTVREMWPNVEPLFVEVFAEVAVERKATRFEQFSVATNHWFDISAFPVGDEGSGQFAIVFKDVNERKQADEQLRASEERLQSIYTQTLAGIAETDLTGRFVQVNERYCEIVGRTAKELYGLQMQDITDPDDLASNIPLFKRAVTEGIPFNIEKRYVRPDGSLVWVNNSVSLIRDENGDPKRIAAVSLDVSERKQAELALENRSRQQRAVAALGQFALSEPDLKNVLEEAVRVVADTLGNEYSKVLELLPGGDRVLMVAGVGWKEGLVGKATVPTDLDSQAGYTLVSNGPVISRDLRTETRFSGPQLLIDHGVISGMSCIITGTGTKPWGVLGTHTTLEREFTEDDVSFLVAVANVVSNAIRRSQQEDEVRRSAEAFAAMVEQSPLGIYTVDADFRVRHTSRGSEPAFRNVQPVIGRDFGDVMHSIWPEHVAEEVKAIFRHVLQTGEPYVSPGLTEERKDIGQIESYEWQANRVTLDDGRPGVVCYYFDVTRLQEANRALAESEERFRTLADSIPQLAWMADGEGWIFWYNQRWYEYTGTRLEEMQGWGWKAVHHPDHVDRVVEKVAVHFREGLEWEDTFPIRGKDGKYRWFLSRMKPIRDETGKVVRFFGTNTDITEQLQAEQAKRKIEVMQTQLDTQEKERKRIARDLHDELGQQMTALRFKLDKLSREVPDPLKSEVSDLNAIAKSIDDKVDFIAWELRPAELRELGLVGALEKHIEEWSWYSGVMGSLNSLLTEQPFEPSLETELYRIVQESMNNIHKHAEAGKAEVSLWLQGESVVLTIDDDGLGFDPNDPAVRNGGIGLLGMKERVEMMGGTFEIESAPGNGTSIYVKAPARYEEGER